MIQLKITERPGGISESVLQEFLANIEKQSGFTKLDKKVAFVFRGEFPNGVMEFKISREQDADGRFAQADIQDSDAPLTQLIRSVAGQSNLRVRDIDLKLDLPRSTGWVPARYYRPSSKLIETFERFKLKPFMFVLHEGDMSSFREAYGVDQTGTIHFVNPGQLELFLDRGVTSRPSDFHYPVADNQDQFVGLLEHGLIPVWYYEMFGKNLNIINHGYFDFEHIDRKVFIAPSVYRIGNDEDLNRLPNGGSLADKVRNGETLDGAIRRVLKEELKLGDTYIRAGIDGYVAFDVDKENRLTPKLELTVIIPDQPLSPEARSASQRNWRSLDQDKQ